jgi:hypothetical protein
MQAKSIRIFLVLFILVLIYPYSLMAATERRIALVIGNGAYSSGPLKNPVNDATDMAAVLKKLGFIVTLKKNARLQEMDEAIEELGNKLKRGGVGLFYYAGHGVQVNGANYLLPIGAKINKEADVKYQAVDANRILDEMATANNGLNIVILDACRDNPFARSFRSASRGLAIVSSAPSGTFISYSTSPGNVARDGDRRNSPYAAALIKFMQKPGVTISDVFINVRTKLKKETGQVPWELSSLEGEFYFVPGSSKTATDVNTSGKMVTETDESKPSATDELDEEQRKVELEKQRLEKEEALLIEKKALEEKRQKIEDEKAALEAKKSRTLAMARPPEVKKDSRFTDNGNGTVTDTKTGLMWAARDNGSDINWHNAKSYCENYRGGGYTDWRMPRYDELAGLYDASLTGYVMDCDSNEMVKLTHLIHLSCCCPWASETHGSNGAFFLFNVGYENWWPQSVGARYRALPVRSGK